MNFHYTNLETCHKATGVVIVIDVLRAFSTATYALARCAEKIILVGDVEEALSLKSQFPNSKVMGEVRGLRPDGFDFGMNQDPIRRCASHLSWRIVSSGIKCARQQRSTEFADLAFHCSKAWRS